MSSVLGSAETERPELTSDHTGDTPGSDPGDLHVSPVNMSQARGEMSQTPLYTITLL